MTDKSPLAVARVTLKAMSIKTEQHWKKLVADDFHFSSPLNNGIDPSNHMKRCWPNSANTDSFNEIYAIEDGDHAHIAYEAKAGNHRFRNSEVYTVKNGKFTEVEVYFGWDLPHKAVDGGFIDHQGGGADAQLAQTRRAPRETRQGLASGHQRQEDGPTGRG